MPEDNEMITMRNISKTYVIGEEPLHVLKDVSLCVERSDFLAIIGPSGSGKSTLMNIIGCLDTPDEGEYLLDGQDVTTRSDNELSAIRNRKIGFIFQQFNLLGKLSALDNAALPLIYQGVLPREAKKRAAEALEKVGLADRMKHRPNELSGGQQQRVAIARALITNPALLLADEPTGNLDSKSGREIMGILHGLHAAGNTIVLITHDEKIASEAQKRVLIRDGIVTPYSDGEPKDVTKKEGGVTA